MAVQFNNQMIFSDSDHKLLSTLQGDVLCFSLYQTISQRLSLDLSTVINLVKNQSITPIVRLSVLYPDESVNYIIPPSYIIQESVQYNEQYTNGQRRDLSFQLINIKESKYNARLNQYEDVYTYAPNVDGLWYGTKIQYEQGIRYQDNEYYFPKGIYIIDNFDMQHSSSARDITYQCTDKFGLFEGSTGVLNDGYEIPVDSLVEDVVNDLLNLSNADGYINDPKCCILDSKYINFKTQATIRVNAGATISELIEQLAMQMSAEYYYNTVGHLVFYPIDESMNDVNKPIIWVYNEDQMEGLQFAGSKDVVNVIKVVGNNVDQGVYSAVAKNTNLNSPINIYHIKERSMAPVETANIFSDEAAQEFADFQLRSKSVLILQQSCSVPYNPMLVVNNIVEIENKDLNIKRSRYLISGVSYTSGSATMNVTISNINNLPIIGGVSYGR